MLGGLSWLGFDFEDEQGSGLGNIPAYLRIFFLDWFSSWNYMFLWRGRTCLDGLFGRLERGIALCTRVPVFTYCTDIA
jgi:hypothetical protein